MSSDRLIELLIPYWQEAGFQFDPNSDRAWLEQMSALIAPSLTRLADAAKESRLLFGESVTYSEEAIAQLKLAGVAEVIQAVLDAMQPNLSEADMKEIVDRVTKTQNVKKGLVMKSLRAALMGELQGPDLMQSWLLFNQKGWDKIRLQQALSQI
jgi:glutamyl-tRNA synthetase